MTRLLFPEAFGLIAAATSILVGLALISDFGIRTVILQSSHGGQEDFLRTAWTLQACRGLVLWSILVIVCVVISLPGVQSTLPANSVFADPHFSIVTAALGLSLIAGGLESTAIHLNVRELSLKPIFFLDLAARIVNLPIMIVWAWVAPSVWALVSGALVAGIIRLTISHISLPGPRMSFQWNRDHVRAIVRFGKWTNLSSIATFLGGQSDRIILGLLLPSSIFGIYAIARMLIETAHGAFERLNATLALPILSEVVRKNTSHLKNKYYRFRLPFDLSAPFLGGLLTMLGSLIVNCLFDRRYADVGPMVQILAVGLMFYPSLIIGSAFTANGEPRVPAAVSVIQAITLISCLIIGYLVAGTTGALWGGALHKLVPAGVMLSKARERGWIDFRKELTVVPIFVAGMAIGKMILVVAGALGYAMPLA